MALRGWRDIGRPAVKSVIKENKVEGSEGEGNTNNEGDDGTSIERVIVVFVLI